MRVLAPIALFFFAGAFAGPASAAEDCATLALISSLPATPEGNRLLVPVTLNGQPEKMLLDTGADTTVIGPATVKSLNLHQLDAGNFRLLDSYGNASRMLVRVDFTLGLLNAAGIHFMVSPTPDPENPSTAGNLGGDVLQNYDVEIDNAAGKVNIFSQKHCPGRVVYWHASAAAAIPMTTQLGYQSPVNNSHVFVPVTLDGKQFMAMIDTGATRSNMSAKTAKYVFGVTPDGAGSSPLGSIDGDPDHIAFMHAFSSLTFGGVAVNNPQIEIIPDLIGAKDPANSVQTGSLIKHNDDDLGQEVTIGMDVLKDLHIYIAYGERKLYVTPPATAASLAAQ